MRFVLPSKRSTPAPPPTASAEPSGPATVGQIMFGGGERMKAKHKLRKKMVETNLKEIRQQNRMWLKRKQKLQRDMRRGIDESFQKYGVTTYEMKKNLKKAQTKALRNLNRVKIKEHSKLRVQQQQRLRSIWRDSGNFDTTS